MTTLRESKWQVILTIGGPQPQTVTKTVDAPSEDVAIFRAKQTMLGVSFLEVVVSPMDQQQTSTQQAPLLQQQLPKQMQGLKPLQDLTQPGQQQESVGVVQFLRNLKKTT